MVHPKSAPPPVGNAVGPQQGPGHGDLVPGTDSSDHGEAVGELGAVAERTLDCGPDVTGPRPGIGDPSPLLKRRMVADVLVVEAGQFRHPLSGVVGMEGNDGADHRRTRGVRSWEAGATSAP